MKYRTFGSTGLEVSAIGFGAMPLSLTPARPSENDAIAVVHHAIDRGITLIDTADSYCIDTTEAGHNERLIGKAMAQLPEDIRSKVAIATKGGLLRPNGRWARNGRPEHLRGVCEQSLKNLGVERIAIYYYHRIDPQVPLADSIGELARLQGEGKIAHVAVSNHSVSEIDAARSLVGVVGVQNEYSLRHRLPERQAGAAPTDTGPDTSGTLAASAERGMAFVAWAPLATAAHAKALGPTGSALARVAGELGASPQQVALAWLLSKGEHVFAIPGASRKATIEDSAKAAEVTLTAEQIALLDAEGT